MPYLWDELDAYCIATVIYAMSTGLMISFDSSYKLHK